LLAYGIFIADIFDLFVQPLQKNEFYDSFASQIKPHKSQINTLYLSDTSISLSFKNLAEPCDIIQSLSISPNLNPPSLDLPSVGYLVKICTGPLPLE
jgi:hypothetical protein